MGTPNFYTPVTSTLYFDTSLPHKGQSLSVNKIHHWDTSLYYDSVTSTRNFNTNPSVPHKFVISTQKLTNFWEDDGFRGLKRSDSSVEVTCWSYKCVEVRGTSALKNVVLKSPPSALELLSFIFIIV